ncbi:MAG: hypothetical protein KUG82_02040 [Pseudomonadales bacterium]|nr:hypothetical protein [Pseudomonadales bacterium]
MKHLSISFFCFTILAACGGSEGEDTDTRDTTLAVAIAETSTLFDDDADCFNGGTLVETGLDENGNGILDEAEVNNFEKVCNGVNGGDDDGGLNSLIATLIIPPGSNCSSGGIRIDSGIDSDENGNLGSLEISNTTYVCNSQPDADIQGLLWEYHTETSVQAESNVGYIVDHAELVNPLEIGPRLSPPPTVLNW